MVNVYSLFIKINKKHFNDDSVALICPIKPWLGCTTQQNLDHQLLMRIIFVFCPNRPRKLIGVCDPPAAVCKPRNNKSLFH